MGVCETKSRDPYPSASTNPNANVVADVPPIIAADVVNGSRLDVGCYTRCRATPSDLSVASTLRIEEGLALGDSLVNL